MTPDPKTIQFLWQYMVHADGEMIAAANTVPDEGYHRDQNISFGSLEKLLNHSLLAQDRWLDRLNGKDVRYTDIPAPPRLQFAAAWAKVHQALLAFAAAQTPETLIKCIQVASRAGQRYELPIWAAMLHVSDHATYHRGQLNSMIKFAGGKPSPVMLSSYTLSEGLGKELV